MERRCGLGRRHRGSYTDTIACGSSDGGTLEVTFNRTRREGDGTISQRRVSWWAVEGARDRDLRLERRECSGTLATIDSQLASPVTTIVADQIGVRASRWPTPSPPSAAPPTTRAPSSPAASTSTPTTPSSSAPSGAIYGAGVPLEVNTLYSSSATRRENDFAGAGSNDKFRLKHYDTSGTGGERESIFTNALTLAPGLDPSLGVAFKVQQRTTGLWLQADGSWAAGEGFIGGTYVDAEATWKLPMSAGTESDTTFDPGIIDAGGEYRVWTQLTEAATGPKQYGGAEGFPLWFDWLPDRVAFISNDTSGPAAGADTSSGVPDAAGVPKPRATWNPALAVTRDSDPATAGAQPRPELLVRAPAESTPLPKVDLTSSTVDNNVTLQGGFTDRWLRVGPNTSAAPWQSFIEGSQDSSVRGACPDLNGDGTADGIDTDGNGTIDIAANDCIVEPTFGLRIDGRTGIRIQQLEVESGQISTTLNYRQVAPSASSVYAVMARNGASFTALSSDFQAFAGLEVSRRCLRPRNGGPATFACSRQARAPSTTRTRTAVAAQQPRRARSTTRPARRTRSPRRGRTSPAPAATAVVAATSRAAQRRSLPQLRPEGQGRHRRTEAHRGRRRRGHGTGGNNPTCNGGERHLRGWGKGGTGASPKAATTGAGFATYRTGGAESAGSAGWVPGYGENGNPGTAGGGGGGGGGGAGSNCLAPTTTSVVRGRVAATADSGGDPGGGGVGGGSSIGLYLHDTGTVRLVQTGVSANTGGRGRAGGAGGIGGTGGAGGRANTNPNETRPLGRQ